jgi:membrane protein YdbS with pleckstrin-like domain
LKWNLIGKFGKVFILKISPMQDFTNETIDTKNLPKMETVVFSKLHPSYWKVVLISLIFTFLILAIVLIIGYFNIVDWSNFEPEIYIIYPSVLLVTVFFSRINFIKKAFAFRNHDVLFRNGIIATNTIVIPYNRVQHVALHEGLVSRYFGLATVQIYTAGGSSSDIEIPGIKKEEAENIKQLLMLKIQKEL